MFYKLLFRQKEYRQSFLSILRMESMRLELNPASALASPNSQVRLASPNSETRFPAACGGVSERKINNNKGSKIPRRLRRGASIWKLFLPDFFLL